MGILSKMVNLSMMKKLVLIIAAASLFSSVKAQEIQARLSIMTNKVSSQVDKKIFQTLQTGLTNFLNTRKWTSDGFQVNEKIQCSFLISIEQDLGNNLFKGKLTVQAARPAYNTSYESPLINYLDDNITFKYTEFQPIEFNENRVQGNDPLVANLPALLAFYVNIILGFDYDSYTLRGGDQYFQKAWNIVNNAPDNREITGWKSFDGLRNRYWLAENLNNNRFALIHEAVYNYYRFGVDQFYDNEDSGRTGILTALNSLNTLNTENMNSMILAFFMQGKANELVKIFSKANADQKATAKALLTKLDLTNISLYKTL
jgi:hypothetical protein